MGVTVYEREICVPAAVRPVFLGKPVLNSASMTFVEKPMVKTDNRRQNCLDTLVYKGVFCSGKSLNIFEK